MSVVVIRRSDVNPGEWHKPEPLTWHLEHGNVPGTMLPVMVCDQGHESTIRTHSVGAGGIVRPSSVCPVDGCGFHQWVKLEGWDRPDG